MKQTVSCSDSDINLSKITRQSWDSYVAKANSYLSAAEKIHSVNERAFEQLLIKYAWTISILQLVAPNYIDRVRGKVASEVALLEQKLEAMWKLGDAGKEPDWWVEGGQFDQVSMRYLRLIRQTEALNTRGGLERQKEVAMSDKSCYWLMDGRASYDIDKATVLECCDTYEKAVANINGYGSDTCIVEIPTEGKHKQRLIWCLLWGQPARETQVVGCSNKLLKSDNASVAP